MKLEKKKSLASRALGIGKERIVFNSERLNEIKEAITKQDIKDLVSAGAIHIKDKKGRKKAKEESRRRGYGKVRQKPKKGKTQYVILTRKLRSFIKHSKDTGKISQESYLELRKEVRNRTFKSLAHLKERIK